MLLAFVSNWCSFPATLHAQTAKIHPAHRPAASAKESASEPRPAQAINYAQAVSGAWSDQLISISGVLASQLQDGDSTTFLIQTDGHLVSAHLHPAAPAGEFEPGSVIRVTGVCRTIPASASQAATLAPLEMRTLADVQVLSSPPWYTLAHILECLGGLLLLALALAIRTAFLKWRAKNQKAWINRSMLIARERSRILELISSNHGLDQLLDEICRSVMHLLPGATCSYTLELEDASSGDRADIQRIASGEESLYEVSLHDDQGKSAGKIAVFSTHRKVLAADREEVYTMLSQLAALAMRQSLLYRGLLYHSTHDPLTELPNRRLWETRLAAAISEAEIQGGQLAVIYIDINRFKYVNDKFGHKIGDLYLQQISNRLRAQLRSIDTLARIGGDEFVAIAPFPEGFDRTFALTSRLMACFDEPFLLEGTRIDGSASFGFARYPEHGATAEELTRHADHAMYVAKHEDRISDAAHGMAVITPDELELALLSRRFRLAYQPQFSVTGHLTGLEALIRLDDPTLGLLTPDAFISVAERHPVIVEIGAWALRSALIDARRWGLNKGEPVTIAVNVSVRQLEEAGYANSVLACLKEIGFPPERLEIELIERSLAFGGEIVLEQLEKLRAAGVRVSLDDFGTEQSCLSMLHKLPIDTIKLDRSFIRAMDDEPGVLPIIQAIVSMAHSLGKRVVAEAIEHVGPVPALRKMGKMDYQGYLLSRPVPSELVSPLIEGWRSGIEMPEAFREQERFRLKQVS